jgi:phage baseplate assembly protein W
MAITVRKYNYSDLDLDFIAHPATGDVVRKFGQDAIKRSLRNLVLTNFYEKPFRPGIGSNVTKLLFENATPIVSNLISDAIRNIAMNYEPRIDIQQVSVKFSDAENGYNVSIVFVILNRNEPVNINLFLERIR